MKPEQKEFLDLWNEMNKVHHETLIPTNEQYISLPFSVDFIKRAKMFPLERYQRYFTLSYLVFKETLSSPFIVGYITTGSM